jgi:hypothetical protein
MARNASTVERVLCEEERWEPEHSTRQLIAGDADNPPDPTVVLLIEHALQAAYHDGLTRGSHDARAAQLGKLER